MKRFLPILLALALGACATATPYQPATPSSGGGYSERRIEDNRYQVSFRGNSLTERDTVETYLLFRAAELTLAQGFDYFIVTTRDVNKQSRVYAEPGPYAGFRPYYSWYAPRFGWRPFYDPFWDDTTYREVTKFEATAEIVMRRGQKPADDPKAFDARQVQSNLQGSVVRPTPG